MDLETLVEGDEQTNRISIRGHEVEVTWRSLAYTPALEEKLDRARKNDLPARRLAEVFLELVTGWNLHAGGKPIPLTAAGLKNVPSELLGEILDQLGEEAGPDPTRGGPSSGG